MISHYVAINCVSKVEPEQIAYSRFDIYWKYALTESNAHIEHSSVVYDLEILQDAA